MNTIRNDQPRVGAFDIWSYEKGHNQQKYHEGVEQGGDSLEERGVQK